jgi:hypothetical protein
LETILGSDGEVLHFRGLCTKLSGMSGVKKSTWNTWLKKHRPDLSGVTSLQKHGTYIHQKSPHDHTTHVRVAVVQYAVWMWMGGITDPNDSSVSCSCFEDWCAEHKVVYPVIVGDFSFTPYAVSLTLLTLFRTYIENDHVYVRSRVR